MAVTDETDVVPEAQPAPPAATLPGDERGVSARAAFVEAARVTLLTRILFFVVAFDVAWLLAPGPFEEGFFEIWRKWDATHLLGIAEDGYFDPGDESTTITAFFPLYPLVVRGVSWLGVSTTVAGLLIATLSCVVAFAYLYRLAADDGTPEAGRHALLYWAFFPTAVFLIAPYSESLFAAGAVAAFYYGRRGDWLKAALPAAVTTGTRALGVFVLVGLAVEFLRQRRFSRDQIAGLVVTLVVGVIPIGLYMYFLYKATGNAFEFFGAQREGWGRELTNPVDSFLSTFQQTRIRTNWIIRWRLELAAGVFGAAMAIWALLRKEWGYAAFMGTTIVAATAAAGAYFSIPRIVLTFFPAMLFFGSWTAGNNRLHTTLVAILGPVATIGVIVFTQGHWFF